MDVLLVGSFVDVIYIWWLFFVNLNFVLIENETGIYLIRSGNKKFTVSAKKLL